ncbi:hypothetical protein GALL_463680 [mine drainage metagenome]|uniref:Uncharacterized protein n=1 Tax=mine drainage metagenome TaxID=410659 RepID=A0A1J5PWS5_9ZZZZ
MLVAGGGGGAILRHAEAAFQDHTVEVKRRGQAIFRGLGQVVDQCFLDAGLAGVACQDEGPAKLALRAAASRRFFVPAVAFFEITQVFRAGGQDEPQDRLSVGGTGFGGAPGPFGRGRVVWFGGGLATEQSRTAARAIVGEARGHAVKAQRRQQRLRLHIALFRRTLYPAYAVGSAGWDAGAFQVAAANAEFRFRDFGPGRAGQQREGALGVALFQKLGAPAERRGGGKSANDLVE